MARPATSNGRWPGETPANSPRVRDLIGGLSNLPQIAADASNLASLKAMAEYAKVYGPDFVYDEMMMTGPGLSGEQRAKALARREAVQNALIGFAPTRALIRSFSRRGPDRTHPRRPATPVSTTSCLSARPAMAAPLLTVLSMIGPNRAGAFNHGSQ